MTTEGTTMTRQTKEQRALAAEEKSARYLARANELAEQGKREAAERFYDRATRWLMKANDLRGW